MQIERKYRLNLKIEGSLFPVAFVQRKTEEVKARKSSFVVAPGLKADVYEEEIHLSMRIEKKDEQRVRRALEKAMWVSAPR